jgi:hypothetical protein
MSEAASKTILPERGVIIAAAKNSEFERRRKRRNKRFPKLSQDRAPSSTRQRGNKLQAKERDESLNRSPSCYFGERSGGGGPGTGALNGHLVPVPARGTFDGVLSQLVSVMPCRKTMVPGGRGPSLRHHKGRKDQGQQGNNQKEFFHIKSANV